MIPAYNFEVKSISTKEFVFAIKENTTIVAGEYYFTIELKTDIFWVISLYKIGFNWARKFAFLVDISVTCLVDSHRIR
jgi:hypothetical protein